MRDSLLSDDGVRFRNYDRRLLPLAEADCYRSDRGEEIVMDDDKFEYQVLVNHEEQYSLWPTFKEIPNGWRQVGPIGTKAECLAYVEEVWTDITPLSVRQQLAEAEAARKAKAH